MNAKATRKRMVSCFAQIIHDYVLGYKIPELVKNEKSRLASCRTIRRCIS